MAENLFIMHLNRYYLLVIFLVSIQTITFSQNWNAIYSKELEAEYFIAISQFEKAAEKYKDALKLIPSSANLKFKIGYSYIQTDDKKLLAIDYLKEAAKSISTDYDSRAIKETNAPIETYYFLAKIYQITEKFDEAIAYYRKYQENINEYNEEWDLIEQQIRSCTIAPTIIRQPVPFRFSNIGNVINNEESNFNAVFSNDGLTMAFTSTTRDGLGIFVSKKKNNEWTKPKEITYNLRGKSLITSSLSFDGTELFMIETFDLNRDIYVSDFIENEWTKAVKLKKPINSKYNETHASVSDDGNTMYFTSNRPGGFGGLDIYKSIRNNKGKWEEPVNMGPIINTKFDEEIPFVTTCGKYLFFSSQGHSSIGGFDVFYIDISKMDEVVNVGYPINNSDDNFYFPTDRFTGHMALYNDKSLGQKDIFRFKLLPWINFVTEVIFTGDQSSLPGLIRLHLLDKEENSPVIDTLQSIDKLNFSIKLKPGVYQLTISAEGIETNFQEFVIPEEYSEPQYLASVQLVASQPAEPLLADVSNQAQDEIAEPLETEPEVTTQEHVDVKDPVAVQTETPKVEEPKTIPTVNEKPAEKSDNESRDVSIVIKEDFSPGDFYTVQIMALRNPVQIDYFKNLSNVTISKGTDEIFRYTVGLFDTMEEAKALQLELKQKGYSETFIRKIQAKKGYTIQIMALAVPRDVSIFKNLDEINVTKGSDELHRYTYGDYSSIDQAKSELQRIISLGYRDAFIKKTIK